MVAFRSFASLFAGLCIAPVTLGAAGLHPANLTLGRNLQSSATIRLSEPAPDEGLEVRLASEDPGRIRLSRLPDLPGTGELTLAVKPGMRETPEFWVHAMGEPGEVYYTASASGFGSVQSTVTITASAVLLVGPFRAPRFQTTPRAEPTKLMLYPARLDASGKYAEQQALAAGLSVEIELTSSNTAAGDITDSPVRLTGGAVQGIANFQPAAAGTTTITASVPPGFTAAAEFRDVTAAVRLPGIALMDDVTVGQNLQVGGAVGLGEPAPPGGVTVTVSSSDPRMMLVSASDTAPGSPDVKIHIPEGGFRAPYFLQALGKSGHVTYTATAPGHMSRTATVRLAPSGVVVTPSPYGPPDEAELHRREAAISDRGFIASLAKRPEMDLVVWTAQLDPVTLRAADITVQPLRAGLELPIELKSGDEKVAKVPPKVVIKGGSDHAGAKFTAVGIGSTMISASTPAGFTTPANSTAVKTIVRE